MDIKDFKEVVAKYIGYNSSAISWDDEMVKDLCVEFDVSKATVVKWASYPVKPAEVVKEDVIEYILKENFKSAVAGYIWYDPSASIPYNEGKAWNLAGKFGVPKSTVIRWISGKARPHPLIRQQIVEYIHKQNAGL